MNKPQLIEQIAKHGGMVKAEAANALEAVCRAVKAALRDGEAVAIPGFGTFEAVEKPERQGRNPKTGETIAIPACKAVKFKAAKALKDAVNA